MADDRHIGECWKRCTSPISGPIWTKLEPSHPISCPRHACSDAVAMVTAVT